MLKESNNCEKSIKPKSWDTKEFHIVWCDKGCGDCKFPFPPLRVRCVVKTLSVEELWVRARPSNSYFKPLNLTYKGINKPQTARALKTSGAIENPVIQLKSFAQ